MSADLRLGGNSKLATCTLGHTERVGCSCFDCAGLLCDGHDWDLVSGTSTRYLQILQQVDIQYLLAYTHTYTYKMYVAQHIDT